MWLCNRRSRLKVLDHYGLWWIVLLLYTHVVHTSLSILNCPYIETLGEYVSTELACLYLYIPSVWYYIIELKNLSYVNRLRCLYITVSVGPFAMFVCMLVWKVYCTDSLTLYQCPRLIVQRWFVNGSVQCFSGWHVPLGLLAILILVLCFAVIPLTVIIVFHKYPRVSIYYTVESPIKNFDKHSYPMPDLYYW